MNKSRSDGDEHTSTHCTLQTLVPFTLTLSLCPRMDRKEGAEVLHDDTLTDERETQICACVRVRV